MKKHINKSLLKRGFCRSLESSRKDTPGNLKGIVSHYIKYHRPKAAREFLFFKELHSLEKAIEYAALAIGPYGKKFSHQWRIPRRVLEKSCAILCQLSPRIQTCRDFEELIDLIYKAIGDIHGIGELTVYDTSLRIGAKLGLKPHFVYLHAGTKEGAKVLGININRRSFNPAELPDAFRKLRPHEMEDCLCIYKEEFAQVTR